MSLTPELLAALAAQGRIVAPVLMITLPSGLGAELGLPDDFLRVAQSAFCSPIVGRFDSRVITFGRSGGGLTDKNGNLPKWQVTTRICDLPRPNDPPAQSIGPFGMGIKRADLAGAVATLQMAAEGVDPSDWWTERTGVLVGWQGSGGAAGWSLQLVPDDEALRRSARRLKITESLWPDAFRPPKDQDQKVIGEFVPIALGRVDSTGLGDHGLRRTLLVDKVRHWYLVSLGTVPASGFRVFVDGVEQFSGFTRVVTDRGGRTWTVVEFTSALTDTQIVQVDCQGLDLGSYGTYTNPAAQLQWGLEHLVFADWNGGDLLPATRTDSASFSAVASALGTREGAPGWLTLGNDVTGEEMIRRLVTGHGVDLLWNPLGLIAASFLDPRSLDVDASPNVIIQGQNMLGDPELLTPTTEERWQAISCNYLLGPDGKGVADLSVYHPRHVDAAPHALANQWATGRVL
jgi:hypothetical protein